MFRITEDPSSGSLVQCLVKNYKNDSIVSVDMDKVGYGSIFLQYRKALGCMLEHFYMFYNFNCIYILYIVH